MRVSLNPSQINGPATAGQSKANDDQAAVSNSLFARKRLRHEDHSSRNSHAGQSLGRDYLPGAPAALPRTLGRVWHLGGLSSGSRPNGPVVTETQQPG
jgi:hypothetical protein